MIFNLIDPRSIRMLLTVMLCLLMLGTNRVAEANEDISSALGSIQRQAKPNIVLCMADDQGWGDVGFRGHESLQTPVMDELASTAIRFDRFYAAAPVCSPTRGSVLTGRHPNRFGCFSWGYPIRPAEVTIAEQLQEQGYVTGHFGKWHLGSVLADSPTSPGRNGFDEWLSAPNFFENNPTLSDQGTAIKTEGEGSEVVVDRALRFIQSAVEAEKPFFAVVWFGSPHLPHQALPSDREPYADLPAQIQNFYGEISAMDRALGKLRSALRDWKIAEETILWYTSDNGALPKVGSAGGLQGKKGALLEGGIRVPAMIEWPGTLPDHQVITAPCGTVDILPTLLDLAGIESTLPHTLDGQSLKPLLKGEEFSRVNPLCFWVRPVRGIGTPSEKIMQNLWSAQHADGEFQGEPNANRWEITETYSTSEFPGPAAIIHGKWKLHVLSNTQKKSGDSSPKLRLYDLDSDPGEQHDLAAQEPEQTQLLHEQLVRWQTSVTESSNGNDYDSSQASATRWFKGNLHTHSLWSDGNDFPEMIAAWYKDHGYNFLTLSDHNVLSRGERWMRFEAIAKRGGHEAVDKYEARFGKDWVETRGLRDTNAFEVRLRPLDEFRSLVEKPGEFLMIQSEEISDSAEGKPVHMNAANLERLIRPVGGDTVRQAIANNMRAAQEEAERSGRSILVHLNHPNFGMAVTAEDIAYVTEERFFEVYNGHPSVGHLGDSNHPSVERLWDIANTLRIAELKAAPLYGVGTDDSHNYHNQTGATSGRGWVMVRAENLEANEIVEAMKRGDFYASSGVSLEEVQFDSESKELRIVIAAEEGVQYRTQFIGTLVDYDPSSKARVAADGKPIRSTKIYSDSVGTVLGESDSLEPRYQLTGRELYVRAVITSTKDHPNPSFKDQKEQAWTQPIGWRDRVDRR